MSKSPHSWEPQIKSLRRGETARCTHDGCKATARMLVRPNRQHKTSPLVARLVYWVATAGRWVEAQWVRVGECPSVPVERGRESGVKRGTVPLPPRKRLHRWEGGSECVGCGAEWREYPRAIRMPGKDWRRVALGIPPCPQNRDAMMSAISGSSVSANANALSPT